MPIRSNAPKKKVEQKTDTIVKSSPIQKAVTDFLADAGLASRVKESSERLTSSTDGGKLDSLYVTFKTDADAKKACLAFLQFGEEEKYGGKKDQLFMLAFEKKGNDPIILMWHFTARDNDDEWVVTLTPKFDDKVLDAFLKPFGADFAVEKLEKEEPESPDGRMVHFASEAEAAEVAYTYMSAPAEEKGHQLLAVGYADPDLRSMLLFYTIQ